jgi:hypothetical protein
VTHVRNTAADSDAGIETSVHPALRSEARPAELAAVGLLLAGFIVAELAIAHAFGLFGHNFWIDEIYTWTLAADPDVGHAAEGLAAGFDTNPPGLVVALRLYGLLAGAPTETSLRVYSLLSVLAALVGVYALLRQVFAPLTALAGVLAVWAHPLVTFHAFEARYYSTWLAAAVWFAFFLGRARGRLRFGTALGLALTSLLLCMVHYFGVLSWGLTIAGELAFRRRAPGLRRPALALAGLGPAALGAFIPLLLSQRAAYSVSTWVDDTTLQRVVEFGLDILPKYLGAVVIIAWVAYVCGGYRRVGMARPDPRCLAGLTALGALPLILVGFSYTVQPVLVDRYAIPAVAAIGPAAAYALAGAGRGWVLAACAFLLASGAYTMHSLDLRYRERDARTAELAAAVRKHTGDQPVLFESVHELYVVCRYAPDVAPRCVALEFDLDQVRGNRFRRFLKDATRAYARCYPEPRIVGWGEVRGSVRHWLVPRRYSLQTGLKEISELCHGFTARAVGAGLYELVAEPSAASDSRR